MSSWPCETPVPASERPTERAIPRAPRVPGFGHVPVPGYLGEWPYEVYQKAGKGPLWRATCIGRRMWYPDDAPDVPEVRYDLAECSFGAHRYGPESVRSPVTATSAAVYVGLTEDECRALADARCELIDWAERLGARF